MGTNYFLVKNKPTVGEPVHIGKSSAGWRFLFHETDIYDEKAQKWVKLCSYDNWKEYIEKSVKNGCEVLMNEYDEVVSPKDFFRMVDKKQEEENPENFYYGVKNVGGYRFDESWFR